MQQFDKTLEETQRRLEASEEKTRKKAEKAAEAPYSVGPFSRGVGGGQRVVRSGRSMT